MRHILKTTAIASSLAAASFVMGADMAKAQTATVPFAGTTVNTCLFGVAVPGVLNIDVITGDVTTTTNGIVPLTCTGAATFSVAAPAATGANALPGTGVSTATVGATTVTSAGAAAVIAGPIVAAPVTVSMTYQVNAPSVPVAPGVYGFDVVVTATPN